MNRLWMVAIAMLVGACGRDLQAAPNKRAAAKLVPITDGLCATKGAAKVGGAITDPTMRAVASGAGGDAAALDFVHRGDTEVMRELASGGARRQLGLKLRAQNGCNLIYVMWRLDPKPKIEVSIKRNPGDVTHEDCGANGYTKLKPTKSGWVPVLASGDRHRLRAAISGDDLTAWIDDRLVWRGTLPRSARTLAGPVGIRSDNLAFDLIGFHAPVGTATTPAPACSAGDSAEE